MKIEKRTVSWFVTMLFVLLYLYFFMPPAKEILVINSFSFLLFVTFLFKKKQSLFYIDFLVLFILFFFFYSFSYPFLYYFAYPLSFLNIISEENIYQGLILNTWVIHGLYFISYVCYCTSLSSFYEITDICVRLRNKLELLRQRRFSYRTFVLLLLLTDPLYIIYIFRSIKYSGAGSRAAIMSQVLSGGFEMIKIVICGISFFCILFFWLNRKRFSRLSSIDKSVLVLSILPLLSFWIIHILSGNRREVLNVIIALVPIFLLSSEIKKKKLFRMSILLGALFIFMSVVRIYSGNVDTGDMGNALYYVYAALGEFVGPHQTLLAYMSVSNMHYLCGLSYANLILFFVPRSIWPNKPMTLSGQFNWDFDIHGIGYAYTPMTEAYVNFGLYSICLFPFIIWCIYTFIIVLSKKNPFWYIFSLVFVVTFNRAEFSTFVFEVLLFAIGFFFFYVPLYKLKNHV